MTNGRLLLLRSDQLEVIPRGNVVELGRKGAVRGEGHRVKVRDDRERPPDRNRVKRVVGRHFGKKERSELDFPRHDAVTTNLSYSTLCALFTALNGLGAMRRAE